LIRSILTEVALASAEQREQAAQHEQRMLARSCGVASSKERNPKAVEAE
jgi:hypothetical protein